MTHRRTRTRLIRPDMHMLRLIAFQQRLTTIVLLRVITFVVNLWGSTALVELILEDLFVASLSIIKSRFLLRWLMLAAATAILDSPIVMISAQNSIHSRVTYRQSILDIVIVEFVLGGRPTVEILGHDPFWGRLFEVHPSAFFFLDWRPAIVLNYITVRYKIFVWKDHLALL